MKSKHLWNRVSLSLHVLIALGVILQVSFILFRKIIGHQGPWVIYRAPAIQLHEYIGAAVFLIVLIYFFYKIFLSPKNTLLNFYPVSKNSWVKIIQDLGCLFLQKKIPVRTQGGLAGLIQGLGLLLVLGLAGLGTVSLISWQFPSNILLTELGKTAMTLHKYFAFLIWWYLGGHVGMAFLHKIIPARFQKEF